MVTHTLKKCPKCGSTDMDWVAKGDDGYWRCQACGYAGAHTQEVQREEFEIISP